MGVEVAVVYRSLTLGRDALQERPCTRCIKRNIGHLCHDEPREPSKPARSEPDHSATEDDTATSTRFANGISAMSRNVDVSDAAGQQMLPEGIPPASVNSVQPGEILSSGNQGLVPNNQPGKAVPRPVGAGRMD